MAFTIPNEASATYAAQAEPDKVDIDILTAADGGTGFPSDTLAIISVSSLMVVNVPNGRYYISGLSYTSTGTATKSITTADATNPRFDLITYNTSLATVVTAGTPAAAPVFPAIPANSVVAAAIYVPAGVTTITSGMIVDKRVFVNVRSAASRLALRALAT